MTNIDGLVDGNPTALFGFLWFTGGLWVLLAQVFGGFTDGIDGVPTGIGVLALLIGALLLRARETVMSDRGNALLTFVGGVAVTLLAWSGGPVGGLVVNVVFVYVAAFAFVSTPQRAYQVVGGSAVLHLAVVVGRDEPGWLGAWLLTWGTVTSVGLLFGIVFSRLHRTAQRLREADLAKDRLLATASHELRTPLTAVIGAADTLLDDRAAALSPERQAALLRMVRHHADRQLRMVEDLLTLGLGAKRRTVPTEPTPVDLATVAADAVAAVGAEVDVRLSPDAGHALVDEGHLERILVNLLTNAHRYGAAPVVLTSSRSGDRVVVEVADHGRGIDGGASSRMFEPFVQGDDGDRRESVGVGLGLTICRELAAANDGVLTYRPTQGGGATIGVELPAVATPDDAATG